ncbi:MAG: hypothetical protein COY40_05920 [Alphaproteobacteria bacterium CG_4_10_14_0_8_um_filter_53_9]|nr:MAG: hypothetical protein COY40_05920 [Alphaproteobacteria bacterium CG_4_10_14_0_8_um_filter_53_9]
MSFEALKVLVVDDHADTQKTLAFMLEEMGISKITTAGDGREALQIVNAATEEMFHIIVCDWNMPNLSGIELLKTVRRMSGNMPFIMITARGDAASVVEAKSSQVTSYILKPFTIEELKKKISPFAAA